jgi:DnaK suppressor protein
MDPAGEVIEARSASRLKSWALRPDPRRIGSERRRVRKTDLERFRKILLEQKRQIVAHARRMLAGEVHVDSDDFPDEIDTAVSESSLSLTGRMREREFGLLAKIEKSLERIERGGYGECESCGEEIGLKRLRARPVTDCCIDCKDEQERLERRAR